MFLNKILDPLPQIENYFLLKNDKKRISTTILVENHINNKLRFGDINLCKQLLCLLLSRYH